MGKTIRESVQLPGPYDIYNSTGFDFPWNSTQGWLVGSPWGGFGFNSYGFSQQYDNGSGFVKPVYLTTYQLKMIRERSRQLAFYNEYCSAVISLFQNYVVGDGFKFKVVASKDDVSRDLVAKTQDLLDLYVEHNNIDQMLDEYVWRLLVEGEACVRHFPEKNGIITVRWVENDLILPPADTNNPDMSFGIECSREDMHDIIGYWIVEKPYEGLTPVLVPKSEVNYDKILTQSNSKRGLPYSFAVDSNFRLAEQILASMISLAVSRSKVSMIRKVKKAPPEGINTLIQNSTSAQMNTGGQFPVGGASQNGQLNIENLPNSSILTSSDSIEYEFPEISLGSQDSEVTLMNNLRAICAHYGISETQLTQKMEKGSYASHLVQESPSFKTFSRWQKRVGDFFCSRRAGPDISVMWRQIQWAVKRGLLPSNAITDLKITYTAPSLLTRDPLVEAQTSKIWFDMGVKSIPTISAEQGLDSTNEIKKKLNDVSLETLLKTVQNIKAAGIDSEGGKTIFKEYHPNVPEALVEAFFKEQESINNEKENSKEKIPDRSSEPKPDSNK